jgi:hypothetical protein
MEFTTTNMDKPFSIILARTKDGQCFKLDQSGKVFTKIAGMIAAPDMEAYESVRMNVSPDFFNTHVVRVAYARARLFTATTSKHQ